MWIHSPSKSCSLFPSFFRVESSLIAVNTSGLRTLVRTRNTILLSLISLTSDPRNYVKSFSLFRWRATQKSRHPHPLRRTRTTKKNRERRLCSTHAKEEGLGRSDATIRPPD